MNDDPFDGVDLNFPLLCNFRVIAHDHSKTQGLIEVAMLQLGIVANLQRSNTSANGKYVTFQFDFMVNNKEEMEKIDTTLRAVEGVRMVL